MTNEELAVCIQKGQNEYIPALWLQCRAFIRRKAQSFKTLYERCKPEIDDLCQCGYFALIIAIRYFNPDTGLKFLTYLARPLKTEFARAAGWLTSKRDALDEAESLDAPLVGADEDGVTLITFIPDSDDEYFVIIEKMFRQNMSDVLEAALKALPDKQQLLIRAIYFDGMTEIKAGVIAGYATPQAAENAHYTALRKLRTGRYKDKLRHLLYSD